jgi:hypothetical protein
MSFNPLDIYARAARRLRLTPGERAMLKTADTLALASLAGAVVAVAQAALAGGAPLSFVTLEHVFVYALVTALLTGLAKLFRASGDAAYAAVGSALESAAGRMQPPPSPSQQQQLMASPALSPASSAQARALAASQAQRLARLRAGGGDATTRPVAAASMATSSATPPQAPPPMDEPPVTPAPSQRVVEDAPADAENAGDENGPPTVQMAAVRLGQETGPTPPTAPAPPSAWLKQ